MPAPAVYIIAVVGTVGVAIAFKEFIYPHLAPRIDRWKAEFQAARKRRVEALRPDVSLTQRGVDRDGRQYDDSHSDHSDGALEQRRPSLRPPVLKNGLLVHRRSGSSETTPSNPGDVELNWITSTSTATKTGSQQQDLRLRKNVLSLNESSHDIEPKKTTATHAFLDESIQPIPYTPLSPRTSTPTHVLYNSSSTHSPLESPLPQLAPLSKSGADDINSSTYPLLTPLQPSSSPFAMVKASASNSDSFLPSPPGLVDPGVAPFLPVSVDGTKIPDSSATSLSPIIPLSSPSALAHSSLPAQLLSPAWSHPSPYQTPPHVHAIPSLSQSYPLDDDALDSEHGLELLSPPSPLSRTDSPFEFTGLSPRPGMVDRSTLLSAVEDQSPASPVESTRSTTYVSFSSPALSASSRIPSENGYENDFSPSEFSSTFSSPLVVPTRLGGDIRSESSFFPHDQARLGLPLPLLSSGSSQPFDVNHVRLRERNTAGWTSTRASVSDFSAVTARSHESESDARRSVISFNDNISDDDYADTRTLRTRSPSSRTLTTKAAVATTTSTSTETHLLESATRRLSRVVTTTSDSEFFDTGSELSDLDFLSMSAGEYEASSASGPPAAAAAAAASGSVLGLGSQTVVYTPDGSGMLGRVGGIRGLGTEDGNESDTSSWSLAGGSE